MRDLLTEADVAGYTETLVAGAFANQNAARQVDRDPTRLTLSGLGGCTRQAAYSVAGTPATDVAPREEARAAMLGTWIHDSLLPGMAAEIGEGAVVEEKVVLKAAGLTVTGSLDLAVDPIVWDLKTVREFRLEGVRRQGGAYQTHRVQVLGYALARYQAGQNVEWVVWLYVNRATGEVEVIAERFTNEAAMAVVSRAKRIAYFAEHPDSAPREARGPGMSFACDRCPWLKRCWGDDAVSGRKGAQRILATREGIEQALALYAGGTALQKQGKDDQEFAKAILDGVPSGPYGKWSLGRTRPGSNGSAPRLMVKKLKP